MATFSTQATASLLCLACPPWWTWWEHERLQKALIAGMSLCRCAQLTPVMEKAGLTSCKLSERLTAHRTAVNRILKHHVQEHWTILYRIVWELDIDAPDVYPLTLQLASRATRYLVSINTNVKLSLDDCRAYVSYLLARPCVSDRNLDSAAIARVIQKGVLPSNPNIKQAIGNVADALEPILQRITLK
jgi:hypothetical protein